MSSTTITAIDIFCGSGAMTLGLLQAGIQVLGGVDISEYAIETYRRNFHLPTTQRDVRTMAPDDVIHGLGVPPSHVVDVLVGAPPYQSFSARRPRDENDVRNGLIMAFAHLVVGIKPHAFLMETSPALGQANSDNLLAAFQQTLDRGGYHLHWAVLDAVDFGVPQSRKRLYCIGTSTGSPWPYSFPELKPGRRTVRDAIDDLPKPSHNANHADPPDHYDIYLSDINRERLCRTPPGAGPEQLPLDLQPDHLRYRNRMGYRGARGYGRLDPDKPSRAIHPGFIRFSQGHFGHYHDDRMITLREGARLQTFPNNFMFCGTTAQKAELIGNATPPLVAKELGDSLISFFERHYPRGISLELADALAQANSDALGSGRLDAQGTWTSIGRKPFTLLPKPSWYLRPLLGSGQCATDEVAHRLAAAGAALRTGQPGAVSPVEVAALLRMCELTGLLFEHDDGRIEVTPLGQSLTEWLGTIEEKNSLILCDYAVHGLAACQMRRPTRGERLRDDAPEMFPFVHIWRAMLRLDDKISTDELRVVLEAGDGAELDRAIEHIAAARGGSIALADSLVDPMLDDEVAVAWMSLAAFGWTLIADRSDGDAFFRIRPRARHLLLRVAHAPRRRPTFPSKRHYVDHIVRMTGIPRDVR